MATLLVVEDERDVITLIRFVLEKAGHTVVEAHNGLQALERLGLEPGEAGPRPDAIVLDIMLPVLDGLAVNARLQQEEKVKTIPVVVLTAKGSLRDLFQQAPNVAAYVEKPFDPDHLKTVVQGVLAAASK